MTISNCTGCGKLQLRSKQMLCEDCLQKHIEESRRIKTYLEENPGATVMELFMQTGFTSKRLNELVRR